LVNRSECPPAFGQIDGRSLSPRRPRCLRIRCTAFRRRPILWLGGLHPPPKRPWRVLQSTPCCLRVLGSLNGPSGNWLEPRSREADGSALAWARTSATNRIRIDSLGQISGVNTIDHFAATLPVQRCQCVSNAILSWWEMPKKHRPPIGGPILETG